MLKQTWLKYRWCFIYALAAALLCWWLFSPHLVRSFRYDSDFARDLTEIQQITQGHWRLIGPKKQILVIPIKGRRIYLFAKKQPSLGLK